MSSGEADIDTFALCVVGVVGARCYSKCFLLQLVCTVILVGVSTAF